MSTGPPVPGRPVTRCFGGVPSVGVDGVCSVHPTSFPALARRRELGLPTDTYCLLGTASLLSVSLTATLTYPSLPSSWLVARTSL